MQTRRLRGFFYAADQVVAHEDLHVREGGLERAVRAHLLVHAVRRAQSVARRVALETVLDGAAAGLD